ncbi:WD40 repeat domain-containing protein [Streptomyces ipomoeae]|uniref:WD40 repeat domain-containing protein n=1 Tax=Streptomyces ipomoeae TaxID=103232 RepID=UPI0015F06F7F|nr:WD40 repeat domain-containing protein [Streptomyces ipomoeae]MDX2939748.1 WD40 repeat domain-containing protein [Streptomyces ipomoeae]
MALLAKAPEGRPNADSLALELAELAAQGRRATATLRYADSTSASHGISETRTYTLHSRLTARDMGVVSSVAFSPDGQMLASAGSGGIHLWDAHTGEQHSLLTARRGLIRVAYSPDGGTVAAVGGSKKVRLWDVHTGQQRHQLALPGWMIRPTGLAFSPDGQRLASCSLAGIRLWDVRTGEQRREITGHRGVYSVAFSPDGQRLASAGSGGICLWDARTGEQRRELTVQGGFAVSVAFSPDGQTLAGGTAEGKELFLWSVRTGELRKQLTGRTGPVLAFGPGGILASGGLEAIHLWQTDTGEKLATLAGHVTTLCSLAFSPDGSTLAVADGNEVALWSAQT